MPHNRNSPKPAPTCGPECGSGLQPAAITDEDIDAIIQKGLRDTEELNNKLKEFTDNAMKFTMDGGFAYDYQDPDNTEGAAVDYKGLAGARLTPGCRV